MEQKFYPAEQTDRMLKMASDTFHGLVDVCNQLSQENAILKQAAAAAQQEKIELQKVASNTGTVSAQNARQFADMLAARSIIKESQIEKYAHECTDPNVMAAVAMQAIKLSDTPVSQGEGVKAASEADAFAREKALWLKAARMG